jgi:hypothetical protein
MSNQDVIHIDDVEVGKRYLVEIAEYNVKGSFVAICTKINYDIAVDADRRWPEFQFDNGVVLTDADGANFYGPQ